MPFLLILMHRSYSSRFDRPQVIAQCFRPKGQFIGLQIGANGKWICMNLDF